jgi:hypothetical protein
VSCIGYDDVEEESKTTGSNLTGSEQVKEITQIPSPQAAVAEINGEVPLLCTQWGKSPQAL